MTDTLNKRILVYVRYILVAIKLCILILILNQELFMKERYLCECLCVV